MIRLVLAAALALTPLTASAQAAPKPARVGVLSMGGPGADVASVGLPKGMREQGYIDGRNFVFETRYAEGRPERLPALAAQLVAAKVDVIVAGGPGPLTAARRATSVVPIVTVSGSDPVAEGWAESLSHPGGNVTGLTVTFPELEQKRLELLKEAIPGLVRVAVVAALFELPKDGVEVVRDVQSAASRLGLQLQWLPVRVPADLGRAIVAARDGRAQALLTLETTFVVTHRPRLAMLAVQHGLPVMGEFTAFDTEGLMVAYGADLNDLLRRAATYVDRILKGARPGELPVERPNKLDLTVNLRVARELGISLPRAFVARADRIIE